MRLRAGIGGLLFCVSACTGLPEMVRVEVDGRMLEIRQQGLSGPLEGGWSASQECGAEPRLDVAELGASVESVKSITPDEVELLRQDGSVVRLYRCR